MTKSVTPFIKRPTTGRTGPNRGPETAFRRNPGLYDGAAGRASAPYAPNPDLEELEDMNEDDLDDLDDLDDDHDPNHAARLSMESARLVADKHDAYRARPDDMRRGYDQWSRNAGGRKRRRHEGGEMFELAGASTHALTRLLTVWLDLLGPLLPPALRPGRGGAHRLSRSWDDHERDDPADDRGGRGQRSHPSEELSVSLEVTSKRPVRVSVELDRGVAPEPLRVRPLRVPGTKGPAIKGAIVDVDGLDRVVVHIVIPDHVPGGTYEGAVLSADGRLRLGRLRVLVRDIPAEPAV